MYMGHWTLKRAMSTVFYTRASVPRQLVVNLAPATLRHTNNMIIVDREMLLGEISMTSDGKYLRCTDVETICTILIRYSLYTKSKVSTTFKKNKK